MEAYRAKGFDDLGDPVECDEEWQFFRHAEADIEALLKVAEAVRGLAYTLMVDVDDQRMWETRMFAALDELEGME